MTIAFCTTNSCNKDTISNSSTGNNSLGKGGSTARFIIVGSYLYVVDQQKLTTFSLEIPNMPKETSKISVGFNMETIFSLGNKLLMGSQNAMYIYDISTPATPIYLSSAMHLRACDPVVANENYAYVTIRSNITNTNSCGGNTNALLIYNISNLQQPDLLTTIPMANPHGLALHRTTLYICDALTGLNVFDLSRSFESPILVKEITNDNDYVDCFTVDNYLYTTTTKGFIIYDISIPLDPIEVSKVMYN